MLEFLLFSLAFPLLIGVVGSLIVLWKGHEILSWLRNQRNELLLAVVQRVFVRALRPPYAQVQVAVVGFATSVLLFPALVFLVTGDQALSSPPEVFRETLREAIREGSPWSKWLIYAGIGLYVVLVLRFSGSLLLDAIAQDLRRTLESVQQCVQRCATEQELADYLSFELRASDMKELKMLLVKAKAALHGVGFPILDRLIDEVETNWLD